MIHIWLSQEFLLDPYITHQHLMPPNYQEKWLIMSDARTTTFTTIL